MAETSVDAIQRTSLAIVECENQLCDSSAFLDITLAVRNLDLQ